MASKKENIPFARGRPRELPVYTMKIGQKIKIAFADAYDMKKKRSANYNAARIKGIRITSHVVDDKLILRRLPDIKV